MKFPSLFKPKTAAAAAAAAPPSRWRVCATPSKTLSFRSMIDEKPTPHSPFSDEEIVDSSNLETAVVSGLKSERLFFEPGATNSILEEAKKTSVAETTTTSFDKECVEMNSLDPVLDFRASMEEMVDANEGDNSWQFLEELLTCYLRVNDRRHRVYIVEAFADLLIHLSLNRCSNDDRDDEKPRCSFTSPLSFTSSSASPSLSPPEKSLQEN